MSLKSKIFLLISILSLFIYLYLLNPHSVQIHLVKDKAVFLPVILLSFIFFIVGMFVSSLVIILSDIKNIIHDWKEKRQIKNTAAARNLYLEGVENILKGNTKRARTLLNDSLAKDPAHIDTYIKIAETYLADNIPNEAVEILKRGIHDVSPSNLQMLLKLVDCYLILNKRDTAYTLLDSYLKNEPNSIHAAKKLRDILVEDSRWQDALPQQEFLTAHMQKNNMAGLQKELNLLNGLTYESAKVFYNEGRFDESLKLIEKILNTTDGFIPAQILKGKVLYKKGNVSSAVKVWEKAYRKYRNAALFMQIEELYLKESLPYRIIKLYKRTIEFHPDDKTLRVFLARLYLKLEMVDEAINEIELLVKEDEGTRYQHLLLAESYARRGRFEESVKSYKNAASIDVCLHIFICKNCRCGLGEWLDRCPDCGLWDTISTAGH